jgi:hypothetical protein
MNDLFNKIVRIVQGIYALTKKRLKHKNGCTTLFAATFAMQNISNSISAAHCFSGAYPI